MNLKEAFRYQNFLERTFRRALHDLEDRDHCLKVTEHHLRSTANPDAKDVTRESEVEEYVGNDIVMQIAEDIIAEKQLISEAIGNAKKQLGWDLDAAIASNKMRQSYSSALSIMLSWTPSKTTETGKDYKFNNDGDQTPYYYDMEIVSEDAYNREQAKKFMRFYRSEADNVSAQVDEAMVTTQVSYKPRFDVNETYDDITERYAKS